MLMRTALTAIGALAFAATFASAQELRPIQGQPIHLGAVSGIVYFEPQGADDHLVATLNVGDNPVPVRFETSLRPGQSAVVSVPRGPGEAAIIVAFARRGDGVFVDNAVDVTQ